MMPLRITIDANFENDKVEHIHSRAFDRGLHAIWLDGEHTLTKRELTELSLRLQEFIYNWRPSDKLEDLAESRIKYGR